jgi:hypothetical protein
MPEHEVGTREDWQAKRLVNLRGRGDQRSQKERHQLPCARLSPVLQAPPECSASSNGDRISRLFPLAGDSLSLRKASSRAPVHELAEGGAGLIDYYRAHPGLLESGQCHGRQWGDRRGRALASYVAAVRAA